MAFFLSHLISSCPRILVECPIILDIKKLLGHVYAWISLYICLEGSKIFPSMYPSFVYFQYKNIFLNCLKSYEGQIFYINED